MTVRGTCLALAWEGGEVALWEGGEVTLCPLAGLWWDTRHYHPLRRPTGSCVTHQPEGSLQPASQASDHFVIQSHGMVLLFLLLLLLLLLLLFCYYRFVPGAPCWSAIRHPDCVCGRQGGPDRRATQAVQARQQGPVQVWLKGRAHSPE